MRNSGDTIRRLHILKVGSAVKTTPSAMTSRLSIGNALGMPLDLLCAKKRQQSNKQASWRAVAFLRLA
jgi:hypothetical protein